MADEVAPVAAAAAALLGNSHHKWFLSLDCECTGRIVPSDPNGELELAPIFAIGCAIGGFNETTGGLAFVPGYDKRLSFAPAANQFDASTREFWNKNQGVLDELSMNANCVDEQDLMRTFWDHWNKVVQAFPGITVVSDCQAFDVGYLLERVHRFAYPLAPMMTLQPLPGDGNYRFVNTYDAGTLEKNTRAVFGQAAIDKIYEAAPVKHTHDPLEDAINTLYMMEGCSRLSGFSLADIDRKDTA
jgi:hypothetical protein